MKKFICITLVLMLLFLTACAGAAQPEEAEAAAEPSQSAEPAETEEVVSTAEIDYYAVATDEDSETVESFAAEIRQQILDKDWNGLADNTLFPITVAGVTYENKDAFAAADWDSILGDSFIQAIEEESCENLFCNSDGIMLGNGEVWFAEHLDDNFESLGLKVIAINT